MIVDVTVIDVIEVTATETLVTEELSTPHPSGDPAMQPLQPKTVETATHLSKLYSNQHCSTRGPQWPIGEVALRFLALKTVALKTPQLTTWHLALATIFYPCPNFTVDWGFSSVHAPSPRRPVTPLL